MNYAFINLLPTKNGYAHYLGSRNTYLKKNQPLAEALALKKYYSLLLAEAEEELSLLNFYIKSHEKKEFSSQSFQASDIL